MAISIKRVNQEIAKRFGKGIALVKGSGYFYFIGESADTRLPSVYVNSICELSLDGWIEETQERFLA